MSWIDKKQKEWLPRQAAAAPTPPPPQEDLLLLLVPEDIQHKPSFNAWDVARICGVHKNTVMNWIKDDRLVAINLPKGHIRIPRATLQEFLRRYNTRTNQSGIPTKIPSKTTQNDTK